MVMKVWAARLILASCGLVLGITAASFNNHSSVLAENSPLFSQLVNTTPITVNQAEFGIKRVDKQGKVSFIPTNKILLKEGEVYGWRINLKNYRGKVKWREVLKLPQPPETWATQDSDGFSISTDGTTAISERTQTVTNGKIENFWTIAPGDPLGKHQIQVYINGQIIKSFDFELVLAE